MTDRLRLIRKNKDKESGVEATEDPEGETDEEEGDASIKSGPGQSTKSVDMSAGAGAAPSVPSPPATQSDDEDWGNTAPAGATADDTDTGSSGAVSDIRSLGTRYGTSEQDRLEMEQVLVDLQATTESSWAAVGEDELRQRQREMFATITGVLKVLERATGAELHAMAVWHDGTHIQACSASTERLSEFDNTSEAGLCRSTFVKYVHDTIGLAMSTAIETAAPTVYGDPDNHMRPTLPPASGFWETEHNTIRLFLEYLWVWQGGLLPVPWSRLLADGQEQKYHLIEQHRLPTGAMYLEDPRLWDEETTGLWSRALRSSGGPARSTFQFRQPRPGLIENETRQIIHPDSHLTYRPESLLYMRRRMMEQAAYPEEWRGLPPIPICPYKPLTPEQQAEVVAAATPCDALHGLYKLVLGYEAFGPYQATRHDWEQAARRCCHLKPEHPTATAGLEHFVHTDSEHGPQLPREFFDLSGPKGYLWDLTVCRAWIDEGAMMHHSGTYMGGPYGFKWLLLLLVHFYSCGSKVNTHLGPTYPGVVTEWSRKDALMVQAMIEQVHQGLIQSVVVLVETKAQRRQAGLNASDPEAGVLDWNEDHVLVTVEDARDDE
ncbi:hypothetical protein FS749_005685 [Ceratobasidium sp. UAMH 11750]|nr:hypothetical protein FS749_005685 [Ceratobasidium sp. UAMH 11750]